LTHWCAPRSVEWGRWSRRLGHGSGGAITLKVCAQWSAHADREAASMVGGLGAFGSPSAHLSVVGRTALPTGPVGEYSCCMAPCESTSSLYRALACPVPDLPIDPPQTIMTRAVETVDEDSAYALLGHQQRADVASGPRPDTVITATIETIDNDRATALLLGAGLPLS
jgi:hypothetical protein